MEASTGPRLVLKENSSPGSINKPLKLAAATLMLWVRFVGEP